jgi:RNA polymerase sporulation-specific sigma factor
LEKDEEDKLVLQHREGSKRARDKLVEHNLRLVVYVAKKFEGSGVSVEDLISIGTIGLIKAVNTFDLDKNIKLATYASRCIENEILMYLRKVNHRRLDISLDEPLNVDWDGNELLLSDVLGSDGLEINDDLEAEDERRILYECMAELSERERLIMNMRFGMCGYEEKTQKEVADELGISQSYISRLEKRIISKLKREIEKQTFEKNV